MAIKQWRKTGKSKTGRVLLSCGYKEKENNEITSLNLILTRGRGRGRKGAKKMEIT